MRKLVLSLLFAANVEAIKLDAKKDDDDLEAFFEQSGESISELTANFKKVEAPAVKKTEALVQQAPAKQEKKEEQKPKAQPKKVEKQADAEDSDGEKEQPKEQEQKQNKETEVAAPFPGYKPVKKIMAESDESIFVKDFISRNDGLNHLLLTDSDNLMKSIAHDFPDEVKVYSIGKTHDGRDMNVLEIDVGDKPAKEASFVQLSDADEDLLAGAAELNDDGKPKKVDTGKLGHQVLAQTKVMGGQKPAILLTGATHSREMISTTMAYYEMLKLLHKGLIMKDEHFQKLLYQNKYMFLPIFNVDGVADIESHWLSEHKIIPRRKNMNALTQMCPNLADTGVDLNRNFGVDFGQVDDIIDYQQDSWLENKADKGKARASNPCATNFPGQQAFSEVETVNFKNYLAANQKQLAFIINIHSNGNAFIYPFNGRQKNDIEERRPGILQIFTQISQDAPFPQGTMKGTSKEVMGIAIGGDQDDWTLAELGIPSVTAEVGFVGQFIDEWQVKDFSTAQDIMQEQSRWIEYIYDHLAEYGEVVFAHQK